jgi:membrane-bound lytic murein transglycosylase D
MNKRFRSPIRILVLVLAIASLTPSVPHAATDEQLLPRYDSLSANVTFWTDVFTKHTTRQVVFHDPELLDIVWEVHDVAHIVDSGSSERKKAQDLRTYIDRNAHEIANRIRGLNPASPANAADRRLVEALQRHKGARPALSVLAARVRTQKGLGDRLCDSYRRSQAYMEQMLPLMAKHGVPEELVYLPLVESGYNVGAHSHKGAVGIYQFTHATGRRYLHIDHAVDERRDPILATEAAAKYLRSNYDRLNSWPLAITGYNHGENGMEYAVRKLGTRDLGVIVASYDGRSFGFASKNFYAELLAAVDSMRIATERCDSAGVISLSRDLFPLDATVWFRDLVRAADVSSSRLAELNPALTADVLRGRYPVPRGYRLRLPTGTSEVFGRAYAALPKAPTSSPVHVVRRGETLSEIASAHRTSVRVLMAMNGIRDPGLLRAGQKVKLPTERSSTAVAKKASPGGGSSSTSSTSVRVKSGDTLSVLAKRHGVSMTELRELNQISNPAAIRVGQVLRLPAKRGAGTISTHRVGRGETLSQIAEVYQTSVDTLKHYNGISDPTKLRSGQTIKVPR